MKLLPKSVWIFTILLFLLLTAGLFPTPAFVIFALALCSVLVVLQAIFILKDEE